MKAVLLDDHNTAAKISKLLILAIPLMFAGVCMDNDFWFVINHGRYILANGFTNIEPFTVHEGLAFSFEKWLTCIVFYKVYDWVGAWGMYVFMLLVFCVLIWLYYKGCLLFSYNNENLSLILTAVCMVCFGWSYMRTRPQIFSYIFLTAEVICLEKYARSGNTRKLWPLPLLSFLYMQFHSTMLPIFFIMMLPYLCDFGFINVLGVKGGSYRKLPILLFMGLSMITTLANPYGVRSFVYLFNSLHDGGLLSNINEVKKSSFNDLFDCSGPVLVMQVMYIIKRLFRKEKFRLRFLFMLGGTFLMAMYAVRNISFFMLMGGLICAWELKELKFDFKIMTPIKKIAGIVVIICAVIYANQSFDIMRSTYAWRALDEFAEVHPDTNVRMYTDFNCGSYAEWKGFRCYADPRAEVFLKSVNGKEDILAEVWDSMHSRITAAQLQEKYGFDYWLVQSGYSLDLQLKRNDQYELIVDNNDDYSVYKYIPSGR